MSKGYGRQQRLVLDTIDHLTGYIWNGQGAALYSEPGGGFLPLYPDDRVVHQQRWHTLEMMGLIAPDTTHSLRNGLTRAVRSLAELGVLEIADTFPYTLVDDDSDLDLEGVDTTFAELNPFDRRRGGRQLWFRRTYPGKSWPHNRTVHQPNPARSPLFPHPMIVDPVGVWLGGPIDPGVSLQSEVNGDAEFYLRSIEIDEHLADYVLSVDRTSIEQTVTPFLGWYFYGWFLPGIRPPIAFRQTFGIDIGSRVFPPVAARGTTDSKNTSGLPRPR